MQCSAHRRLVSKPFTSDPTSNVSRARKIQLEINSLETAIPRESEIEFLVSSASEDDVQNYVLCIKALVERLTQLKKELHHLRANSKSAAEATAERSRRSASEEHDRVLTRWISRETRAHRVKEEMQSNLREKISLQAEKLANSIRRAHQAHDQSVSEKHNRIRDKIELWNSRISAITQITSSRENSDASVSKSPTTSDDASHSLSKDNEATMQESIESDLVKKEQLRQYVKLQHSKRRRHFANRYPVHTIEVNRATREYYEQKELEVRKSVELNRSRRYEELAKFSKELSERNHLRASSAARRHEEFMASKMEKHASKNNLVSIRQEELLKRKQNQVDEVNRMRICRSVELSFRPSTSTDGSRSESPECDIRVASVADRMITRAVKLANMHNITHETLPPLGA